MEEIYSKTLNQLVQQMSYNGNAEDMDLFTRAYRFAHDAHRDQIRNSGEPFFEHPLQVSKILIDYHMDIHTICSGLLHDVPEDTEVTIEEIEEEFGKEIAMLVDGVTKISGINFASFEMKQAENLRKVVVSMVNDIRVILIKFADRLHNMRTIDFLPERKRERIAIETRDIYAPLAHRLGINRLSTELEDHALRALDNKLFKMIEAKINTDCNDREPYVKQIINTITRELKKVNIHPVTIYDSPKHYYNTYIKMKERAMPYEEINDNFSIKIILREVEECYFVLGIVHKLFTPIHERFKDYIATPKSNLYQSLHTYVIGAGGKIMEIQIKTEKMDRIAEDGVVVNWFENKNKFIKSDFEKQFIWLRKILELEKDANDSGDFLENFKSDLFHDEVFVFTPRGDLHRLPRGATPVDFAFSIHSNLGYHCIGAKINRVVVPLNYELQNGDIIEIITSERLQPNPEWINFVNTAKARSKIKRWIKEVEFDQNLKLGRDLLTSELKKKRQSYDDEELIELAQSYGLDVNQFFIAIGRSDINVREVVSKFTQHRIHGAMDEALLTNFIQKSTSSSNSIKVQGVDSFSINFGKCCQPIPGDRILGFLKKGQGIEVHRTDCSKITSLLQHPEDSINVEWDADKDKRFLVRLKILAHNRPNFLKDISESIASANMNIIGMIFNTDDACIHNVLTVEVKNLTQLKRIINILLCLEGVIRVDRMNEESV